MKLRVVLLSLLIAVVSVRIFYWFRVARRTPDTVYQIPSLKWTRPFGPVHPFWTAPLLTRDGSLILASLEGDVYSLDSHGTLLWTYRIGQQEAIAGGLLQDRDGNIYFSTLDKVFSLNTSGLKRWETSPCTPGKLAQDDQGATFDDATLYTTCGKNFAAFNKTDGTQLWSQPPFEGESAPALLQNGTLVFARDRHVVAVDRAGNTLWTYPPPNAVPANNTYPQDIYFDSPVAVAPDQSLYVGSRNNRLVALDSDGILKWSFDAGVMQGYRASPVIASDGTVFVVNSQGVATALSPDGAVKWTLHLSVRNGIQATPILGADGTIYFAADPGVVAISPDGRKLWELALSGFSAGSPTLAPDGTLYIATIDGVLYAVQTASPGLMQNAWPKYQHDAANSGSAGGAHQ
jgi:outer membrane protein assembly factor BamB